MYITIMSPKQYLAEDHSQYYSDIATQLSTEGAVFNHIRKYTIQSQAAFEYMHMYGMDIINHMMIQFFFLIFVMRIKYYNSY